MAGLPSVDNNFPIYLWYRVGKQAEITINLLKTSRTNTRLSAYAQIFGNFDFNATPMAPPGAKIITQEKPAQRATWENTEYPDGTLVRHWNTIVAMECF